MTDPTSRRTVGGVARSVALGAVPPLLLVLLWHFSAESTVIPTIGEVADTLSRPFEEPALDSRSLGYSTLVSLLRVLIGFGLAALTAVPLGVLVGRVRVFREVFSPIIEMGRPICPVVWLPLLIVIFGATASFRVRPSINPRPRISAANPVFSAMVASPCLK